MKTSKCLLLLLLLLTVFALAAKEKTLTKAQAFPLMYDEHPLTIVAIPALNSTNTPIDSLTILLTLAQTITNKGYYLVPPMISTQILEREGYYSITRVDSTVCRLMRRLFNADAILVPEFYHWEFTKGFMSFLDLGLSYKLISTLSGKVLWEQRDLRHLDTNGASQKEMTGYNYKYLGTTIDKDSPRQTATGYSYYVDSMNREIFLTLPSGEYNLKYGTDKDETSVIKQKHIGPPKPYYYNNMPMTPAPIIMFH